MITYMHHYLMALTHLHCDYVDDINVLNACDCDMLS